MRMRIWLVGVALALPGAARAGEVEEALAAIRAVKREGAGNEQAAARWRELVAQGPKALPALLQGFDGADAVAANWLRTAVEAIADNEQKAGRPLPLQQFEAVAKDTKRAPRGCELAFELLTQADPGARQRLLPTMLDDPTSSVLRREAIELALKHAKDPARLKELFAKARDVDQVEKIAAELKKAGGAPDVIGHLNLITRWQVAGPFDNSGLKGFAAPLPARVEWKDWATAHERGQVDLYQALGKARGLNKDKKKDAVYALARTEVESQEERPVDVRAATQNALRIWLNGREIFAREEYHHGMKMDQHVGRGVLKKGRNEILVKVCQDDMTPEWTLIWAFQLRVCDALGGAVPLKVLTAPNATPAEPEPPKKEPMK